MSVPIDQNDLAEYVSTDLGDVITASGALEYVNKSILRINRRLHIAGTSNAVTIDGSGIVTFPDSSVSDIMVMQMECLIAKTKQNEATSKGIRIRSGSDEVDTTAGFGGYQSAVRNVCGELHLAVLDYLEEAKKSAQSDALVDGGAVIWYGEQRKYEEAEHDGQYYERKHPFDSMFDADEDAHDL